MVQYQKNWQPLIRLTRYYNFFIPEPNNSTGGSVARLFTTMLCSFPSRYFSGIVNWNPNRPSLYFRSGRFLLASITLIEVPSINNSTLTCSRLSSFQAQPDILLPST